MSRTEPSIKVAATADELAREAAGWLIEAVDNAVVATGRCAIALSGGSTPHRLYRLLAAEYVDRLPWSNIHILFVDERCVPADHPDSNFGAACRLLLDHVPLPYDNVHRMAGEKDPAAAAAEYATMLRSQFAKGADIALLGMGEDGHTASLFPNTAALEAVEPCVANWVEKLGTWRLTMSAPYLNKAFDVLVLVSGGAKASAVESALFARGSATECPIRLVSPASGRMLWLMDAEAAGMGDGVDDMDEVLDEPDDAEEDETE